jgi:hypothetical protein
LVLVVRRSTVYLVASLGVEVEVEVEQAVAALLLDSIVVAPLAGHRPPHEQATEGKTSGGS